LIEGFIDYPVIGSGFGAHAGYIRNAENPWLYELTYHQMLFNLGIVGTLLLLLGFLYFLRLAIGRLRDARQDFAIRLGILVGFLAILVGSYSNPYLQFFDSLIYVMFFALLCGSIPSKPAWTARVASAS
jgi:O-antigen ligase